MGSAGVTAARALVIAGVVCCVHGVRARDEEKIMRSCYWPNEVFEPCFGGCAEVSCDNPRNHLRPCYPYCEPGCVCEDPYVRDDRTHQCVLPHHCSQTQMGIPIPPRRQASKMSAPKLPVGYGPHGKYLRHHRELGVPYSDLHYDGADAGGDRPMLDSSRLDDVVVANHDNYRDYEDIDKKGRYMADENKWRKNPLPRSELPQEHDMDLKARRMGESDLDRVFDPSALYKRRKHYNDGEFQGILRSVETRYYDNELPKRPPPSGEKDQNLDKKPALFSNCDKEHERFEPCFAGCAAVSCDNPRERLRTCYPFCEPGCVCVAPYVRDDRTHKCVLPDDCTKGLKGIPDLTDSD